MVGVRRRVERRQLIAHRQLVAMLRDQRRDLVLGEPFERHGEAGERAGDRGAGGVGRRVVEDRGGLLVSGDHHHVLVWFTPDRALVAERLVVRVRVGDHRVVGEEVDGVDVGHRLVSPCSACDRSDPLRNESTLLATGVVQRRPTDRDERSPPRLVVCGPWPTSTPAGSRRLRWRSPTSVVRPASRCGRSPRRSTSPRWRSTTTSPTRRRSSAWSSIWRCARSRCPNPTDDWRNDLWEMARWMREIAGGAPGGHPAASAVSGLDGRCPPRHRALVQRVARERPRPRDGDPCRVGEQHGDHRSCDGGGSVRGDGAAGRGAARAAPERLGSLPAPVRRRRRVRTPRPVADRRVVRPLVAAPTS